jgi:flavin reductase (DIM6/NTAB) family NADH-FMN oxidoreductase RutF
MFVSNEVTGFGEGLPMATKDQEIAEVMNSMPYGLYIVGSTGSAGANGMMADWLTQVSFKPRLLGVAIENDATTLANIRGSSSFTINFLTEGQKGSAVAQRFAAPYQSSKIHGPSSEGVRPKLDTLPHRLTARGCPILGSALAWLECDLVEFLPVGDHTFVVGHVLDGRFETDGQPLTSTYTGWTYSG